MEYIVSPHGLVLRAESPSTHTLVAVWLCPSQPSNCQNFKLLELAAILRPRDLLCTEGKAIRKAAMRRKAGTTKGEQCGTRDTKVLHMDNNYLKDLMQLQLTYSVITV